MMTMDTDGLDDFEQKFHTVSSTPEESSGSNHSNKHSTCCNNEDEQVADSYICESNRLWIKKNRQPSPPFPPLGVSKYGLKDMRWLGEKKCHFKMRSLADRFVIPAQCQVILEEFMTDEEKKLVLVNTNSKKMKNGGGLKVKGVDRFGRKTSIVLKKWESNQKCLFCKGWKDFVSKWVIIASNESWPATIVQMWCSRLPADKKFKLFFGFDFISAS